MSYKAFLSYSHAADNQLAPALQSALQRFAKPFYRLRCIRVFRDKSNLQSTPELWPEIQQSLGESEFFILLASPDAAASHWVQQEVGEWLRLSNGSVAKLLLAVTAGDLVWNDTANDFDWERTTALPLNLKGKFLAEPLYSDLRWARQAHGLSLRNPQFLDDVGTIGATLHGMSKDAMVGQDVRQHRIFKFVTGLVIGLLVCLSAGASGAAYYARLQKQQADIQKAIAIQERQVADDQKAEAVKQKEEAVRQQNLAVAAVAREKSARDAEKTAKELAVAKRKEAEQQRQIAIQQRDLATSRAQAAQAMTQLPINPNRSQQLALDAFGPKQNAHSLEAEDALRRAVFAARPNLALGHEGVVNGASFSADGQYIVTASDDQTTRIWQAGTGLMLAELSGTGRMHQARFSPEGRLVAVINGDGEVLVWEWQKDVAGKAPRALGGKSVPGACLSFKELRQIAFSKSGEFILTSDSYGLTQVWETSTGELRAQLLATSCPGKDVPLNFNPGPEVLARRFSDFCYNESVASFSPNGKSILMARGNEALIWEWGNKTGEQAVRIYEHKARVHSVSFNNDGALIVVTLGINSENEDRNMPRYSVVIWKSDDPTSPLVVLSGNSGELFGASFSPDNNFVLAFGWDPMAYVWPWRSKTTLGGAGARMPIFLTGHTDRISSAVFSPDSESVLTSSTDGTARVWKVKISGSLVDGRSMDGLPSVSVLRGPAGALRDAEFSPDGQFVVTASTDHTARIWKADADDSLLDVGSVRFKAVDLIDANSLLTRLKEPQDPASKYLSHRFRENTKHLLQNYTPGQSPTPLLLAALIDELNLELVNIGLHLDALVEHMPMRDEARLLSARFPEGENLPRLNRMLLEDSYAGELAKSTAVNGGLGNSAKNATFSPDGSLVLTSTTKARLWDSRTGALEKEFSTKQTVADAGWVIQAAFSPNGKYVVTVTAKGTAQVWNVQTGQLEFSGFNEGGFINSAAFSADGNLIVTAHGQPAGDCGSGSTDPEARIWDWRKGVKVASLKHSGAVFSATFSPDGNFVVTTSSDGRIRVWNWKAHSQNPGVELRLPDLDDSTAKEARFSPDGRYLAVTSRGSNAFIWDWKGGLGVSPPLLLKRGQFRLGASLTAVAFSPDSKILVTGYGDGIVRAWDTASGGDLGVVAAEPFQINSIDFSPDGKRLLLVSGFLASTLDANSNSVRIHRCEKCGAVNTLVGLARKPL